MQVRQKVGENPFFSAWETPYGVPPFDRILPQHFLPAIERGMSLHDAEIDAIVTNRDEPTFENVILAFDNSGQMLAQTSLVFGMLCAAQNTPEMQALQEQAMPRLTAHYDKILLNDALFERVKAVYDNRATFDLDAEQSRLLEKTYRSFVRAGALLGADEKARLAEINSELALASVKFGNNLLAENYNFTMELEPEQMTGLPAGVQEQAREKARELGKGNKGVFTLQKPSMIPFLTYSPDRELRERIYTAYLNRCNRGDEYDNKQLINDFIRLRTEKAHLLGYPSYAAYVVDDEMAGTTEAVYDLLEGSGLRRSRVPSVSWVSSTRSFARTSPTVSSPRGTGSTTPRNSASRSTTSTRRCCVPTLRWRMSAAASSSSPTASTASPSGRSSCRSTIPR